MGKKNQEAPEQEQGRETRLFMHDSACSFSFDGEDFVADESGVFELPVEAAAVAASHGFVQVSEKPKAK